MWTVADVTHERERQENVFQELQHAIDYLDHAPAGFLSVDPDGAIVYLNATLATWLDYDLAQVGSGGLTLADVVPRNVVAMMTSFSGASGDVRTETFDLDLRRRNGQFLPVRLYHRVAFGQDGRPGPSRTLVLNRSPGLDVDEGQRAAEVRFARFFNNTPVAIATVNCGRPRRPVERALHAAVRDPAAGRRRAARVRRSRTPSGARRQRPQLEAALKAAADKPSDIQPLELHVAGQAERSVRVWITPVSDAEAARARAAILYALDTTDLRLVQEQLAQSQKMNAVGQLAGGVAHDFNNVLQAIIGYSDLLLANHRPTDPSFQDIMQIKQNANRAASLVRQLLAFSRRQTLRPEVLNLDDRLSDLSMLLKRLLGERVELDLSHGRDLWPVKADVNQFEQVVVNLAVNARDAMPDGGKLAIRTAQRRRPPRRRGSTCQRHARGRLRAGRGRRYRHRHAGRRDREDLRALLHDEGGRQGHGPRPLDGVRHRQAVRRLHRRRARPSGRARRFRIYLPRHVPARRRAARGPEARRRETAGGRPHRAGHDPPRRGRGPGARRQRPRAHGARLHGARGGLRRRGPADHPASAATPSTSSSPTW